MFSIWKFTTLSIFKHATMFLKIIGEKILKHNHFVMKVYHTNQQDKREFKLVYTSILVNCENSRTAE